MRTLFFIILGMLLLAGCEKEIDVDMPPYEKKIVVEGSIDQGGYAMVLLTESTGYFDPVDSNTYDSMMVKDATVIVSDGIDTDTLMQPSPMFPYYFGRKIIGEVGKTYTLTIHRRGKTYTAKTTIPAPVPLDSIKFYPSPSDETDSAGFLWLYTVDPDTLGNNYRILTQTVGKDKMIFVHPRKSVFEDKYMNGQPIEFSIYHGSNPLRTNPSDTANGKSQYNFYLGETVIVKFCTLDKTHYLFWKSEEQQLQSDGNPFANPTTPISNIEGGLGIWGGYGVYLDTIVITKDIIKH